MNILPSTVVKTKLEISGKEQILADVVTGRQYPIAAAVGKLKTDDLTLPIFTVLPAPRVRCVGLSFNQYRIVSNFSRSQFFSRRADNRFRQAFDRFGRSCKLGILTALLVDFSRLRFARRGPFTSGFRLLGCK